MSDRSLQQTVVITNPQGFHFRPKAAVAQRAMTYQCDVRLHWNGQVFNGKSMLELLLLAAEQGQAVTVEADGPDAAEALEALTAILAAPGVDEATSEPSPPSVPNT
jgi:phosphotransferase system HPr (HPr) family protein